MNFAGPPREGRTRTQSDDIGGTESAHGTGARLVPALDPASPPPHSVPVNP